MYELRPWTKPLAELLKGPDVVADVHILAEQVFPHLVQWQDWPDLFLTEIGGLFVPPHQRLMLHAAHRGAPINVNVSSRGTAKSATIDALYDTYVAIMTPRRKLVMLSGTGFRGGQMMLSDIELAMHGGWDSQKELPFLAACVDQRAQTKSLVHRGQNWWRLSFGSDTQLSTYPTQNEESIRGIRGHMLFIDEANIFDPDTLGRVIKPFLNVLGDFEHGGSQSLRNAVFYTSTIDYAWRPFMKQVRAAQNGVTRDYDAYVANTQGDHERAAQLDREGLHHYSYVSFDYTDVLIPTQMQTRDGRRFAVQHPDPKLSPELAPKGIPYTVKDTEGNFLLEGPPLQFYRTYPINKDYLEEDLFAGTEDETMWLSEQRNVLDNATGDVYPWGLLQRVSCEREPLIRFEQLPSAWQVEHKEHKLGYSPTVMYTCNDPVVIAVDYAGGERDFCAFVVIRIGPLAEGVFDPFTHHGRTSWSNVIWCEQHRQMSHRNVAEKLWKFLERYPNPAWEYDAMEQDTWKLCRAIGLDMKGGGTGVRDALVFMDQEFAPPGLKRILDPLDSDSRIQAYMQDDDCMPILDAIQPTDMLNDRCADFLLAQMKTSNLWLPKYIDSSERQGQRDVDIGYAGVRTLKHQLQRIQQRPTKLYRQFFMPGSEETIEGKKDMFSAFLYAGKQMRAHIIRYQNIGVAPSTPIARRVNIGERETGRRALGSRF